MFTNRLPISFPIQSQASKNKFVSSSFQELFSCGCRRIGCCCDTGAVISFIVKEAATGVVVDVSVWDAVAAAVVVCCGCCIIPCDSSVLDFPMRGCVCCGCCIIPCVKLPPSESSSANISGHDLGSLPIPRSRLASSSVRYDVIVDVLLVLLTIVSSWLPRLTLITLQSLSW